MTKNKPIEIGQNGDIFKNDRLGRKQMILNLTKLIDGINEPFVLSINGSWGSGKTSFIKLWSAYLKKEGYNNLYFNAWENDFSKDPFLSIVSEIKEQISCLGMEFNGEFETKAKEFYEKGMALAFKSLPILVKTLSNGMLNLEMLKGIVGDSHEGLSELFSDISKNLAREKNLHKDFRESLKKSLVKLARKRRLYFLLMSLTDVVLFIPLNFWKV